MALPFYSWPASGATARGVSLTAFRSGVAVGDWLTPKIWPFNGTSFTAGITLATGTPGLSSMTTDAASGVWAVSWDGNLWHQPAAGTATLTTMPSGSVYTGTALDGYVMASSGAVLTSAAVSLGAWPTAGLAFTGSGTTLAALLPASSGVGSMTIAGVTGLIALPAGMTTPSCLSMTAGSPLAVGGWQTAPLLTGAAAAALSPVDPTVMVGAGTGRAVLWRALAGLADNWTQTQSLPGLATLNGIGWAPDGFHVLVTSAASGTVQSLAYAAGVLSLAQTISVLGANGVAVAGDSLHAVVAQTGQSQVATLVNTGTWTTGVAITGMPGITTVIPYGSSGAVAAYASGLAYLTFATGGWVVSNRLALPYTPSVMTQDAFGQVYTAGSGVLSMIAASGSSIIGSGAWAGGSPTGIAIEQGRLLLAVPTDGLLYEFGNSAPGLWAVQSSGAIANTPTSLALSQSMLFVMTSGSTLVVGFSGTPFVTTNAVSGVVAQRVGGSWTVTGLGVGQIPSALGYDATGNLRVATTQNSIWSISSGGTVLVSGAQVPQYSTQPQAVPLGLSNILAFASGVYLTTSLSGTLIAVA